MLIGVRHHGPVHLGMARFTNTTRKSPLSSERKANFRTYVLSHRLLPQQLMEKSAGTAPPVACVTTSAA